MGVWAGIAAASVDRAQLFIRKVARASRGQMPPGAPHFTTARMTLTKLRAVITSSLDTYAAHERDERALSSLDFQSSINLLKVEASELAVATVMHAMRGCGLAGYRNDGEFSIGRHLRDVPDGLQSIADDIDPSEQGDCHEQGDHPGDVANEFREECMNKQICLGNARHRN